MPLASCMPVRVAQRGFQAPPARLPDLAADPSPTRRTGALRLPAGSSRSAALGYEKESAAVQGLAADADCWRDGATEAGKGRPWSMRKEEYS